MRCGSKPVSAVRKAMRRTFFCACASPAPKASTAATRKGARRTGFKCARNSWKSRNYNGFLPFPGVAPGSLHVFRATLQVDVHVTVALVLEVVAPPAQDPGLDHLVALAVDVELEGRIGRH